MRFLYINEAAEWCREHGMEIGDGSFRLQPDSRLAHTSRLLYSPHGPTDQAPAITEACMSVLSAWDECLLWVTDWDAGAVDRSKRVLACGDHDLYVRGREHVNPPVMRTLKAPSGFYALHREHMSIP